MDDRTERIDTPDPTNAAGRETDARTREIRGEIERTREDLSETVDAIQERLRPANLLASARSNAKDRMQEIASTTTERIRDMAYSAAETTEEWWNASSRNGFVERIRSHPLPALMAGVGLTWLAFSNGRSGRRHTYAGQSSKHAGGESDRWTEERRPGSALRSGQNLVSRLESMVCDYPLAVGAAALLIGASLGMAVPETESENEWMGDARDAAVERAQDAAASAVDRVKDVAAEVVTRGAMGD